MNDYRVICDLETGQTIGAKLPLVIAYDGVVGESKSLRGLLCLLMKEYADAEDETDDWLLRVNFARKECMKAVLSGKDIIVYDKVKGIIENNYAATEGDSDYEYDENFDKETSLKIHVSNEKDFLLSLIKVGAVIILEREDSNQITIKEEIVNCKSCVHNIKGTCNVYKSTIEDMEKTCDSGTKSNIEEYQGGIYNEIVIDDILNKYL